MTFRPSAAVGCAPGGLPMPASADNSSKFLSITFSDEYLPPILWPFGADESRLGTSNKEIPLMRVTPTDVMVPVARFFRLIRRRGFVFLEIPAVKIRFPRKRICR